MAFGTVASKLLAFLSRVILGRLLVPEDLGLIVLIAGLTGFLQCITDVGIKQSIIQNRLGETQEYLIMAWWFQVLRAILVYGLIFFITPWICKFYFSDKIEIVSRHSWAVIYSMVRIAFLCLLFNGFVSPRAHLLERHLNFGKVILYVQGSAVIGSLVTIILVFILRNVWAMVIGFSVQGFLQMVTSYVICPFKPNFKFHRESFDELFSFSRGMFGAPLLAYLAFNIDVLVGGRLLSAEVLGLYGFSILLAKIPRELFGKIINPVLMPIFSRRQENPALIKQTVLMLTKWITLLGLPFSAIAFVAGRWLLVALYKNQKFSEMDVVFGIFCLNVVCIMLGMVFASILLAFGHPSKARAYSFLRAILLALLITPIVNLSGVTGMVLLLLFTNLIAFSFSIYLVRPLIDIKPREMVRASLPGIGIGVFTYCITCVLVKYVS